TPRERRIYLTYGLIATVSSLSLLSLVFVQAGKALIENNQPLLLALLVGFVGLRVRRRLRRLFSRAGDPDDEEELASPANVASTAVSARASEEKSEQRYPVGPAENKALEKRPSEELAS